jgi:SpoVK/Ycf46/Vps4 family AAA+-type ATPase
MPIDLAGLAQPVSPRSDVDDLILPPAQLRQFMEIATAMRNLTQVHYGWGTARAWNECGIPVLFAGPSGTGKTMAAEVLARMLELPMYRINLAQLVDKYIGETEKNLERVLDACDQTDVLLLFDEADAYFGRRTSVRDAHDRYANLEVSFLLERLERFKGLAILATNRREDIDDAFLRRLRYIVEFPVPDSAERRRIWQRSLPSTIDTSLLDLDFLARQFQLTGGNIRSVMLNACLQAASNDARDDPHLAMPHVIVAIVREYAKLQRTFSLDQFGPWASIAEATGHG